MQPEHHLHIRKRITSDTVHPYPSKAPIVRFVDSIIILAGIFGPFASLPQLYEIWVMHNASGVSSLTWTLYSALTLLWLWYGLLHHEKPIIIAQSTWFLFNMAVLIGSLMY